MRPQFRLKTLMIGIAILAPILALSAWLRDLYQAMYEFYGPGGVLERQNAKAHSSEDEHSGDMALWAGHYSDAERAFRSALSDNGRLTGSEAGPREVRLLAKLAKVLTIQGRDVDADRLRQRLLQDYECAAGGASVQAIRKSMLEDYAEFLEKKGRPIRARETLSCMRRAVD